MPQQQTSDERELQARWLAQLRRLVTDVLGGEPVDVYLFGSRARGDHRLASDVDLALDPRGPLSRAKLAALREALEESPVPLRVELVDLSRVDASFRKRVLAEAQPWVVSKSA
jgi:hypothetical protein